MGSVISYVNLKAVVMFTCSTEWCLGVGNLKVTVYLAFQSEDRRSKPDRSFFRCQLQCRAMVPISSLHWAWSTIQPLGPSRAFDVKQLWSPALPVQCASLFRYIGFFVSLCGHLGRFWGLLVRILVYLVGLLFEASCISLSALTTPHVEQSLHIAFFQELKF